MAALSTASQRRMAGFCPKPTISMGDHLAEIKSAVVRHMTTSARQ